MNAFFLHHKFVDSEIDHLGCEYRIKKVGIALFGTPKPCDTQASILTSSWFRICPHVEDDVRCSKNWYVPLIQYAKTHSKTEKVVRDFLDTFRVDCETLALSGTDTENV